MNIKDLKPSKKSRYSQGYIDPRTCKKYINTGPIIYRSSYEKKFIQWCEQSSQVIKWGSECVQIPYVLPDGTTHHYHPDFFLSTEGGNYLVEIKPHNQTIEPNQNNTWAHKEWIKNNCKWKAALDWCKLKNMRFKIITEHTLNNI